MKILMVCLGNICRSPIAQGIMEAKIKEKNLYGWEVDSAGTSGWHDGEGPDHRAISMAMSKGVDISRQISRKIKISDFDYFDLIIAMDSSNYQDILRLCPTEVQRLKVKLMMNYAFPGKNIAVPDPYYNDNFSEVFVLLDNAIEALITKVHLNSEV